MPVSRGEYVTKLMLIKHDDSITQTCILLTQLSSATIKYIDNRYRKEQRLSMIRAMILRVMTDNGGTMTPSELASWTNTNRNNITAVIERMKKDKLVSTKRSRKDKRIVIISLTDEGRDVYKQAQPFAKVVSRELIKGMSQSDTHELARLLNIIRINIESD